MTQALEDVRALRAGLHALAYDRHSRGLTEAAQALWAVVEALDDLLARLDERRR